MTAEKLIHFYNCYLLRHHQILKEDFWIRNGIILDPEIIFFDEKKMADESINCHGALIAPGLIDLQINGGFGIDFTTDIVDELSAVKCLDIVGKGLLKFGVTSYCPDCRHITGFYLLTSSSLDKTE